MKIFCKFPTVNLSKCNFWLVICIELFYQIQSNRFVNLIVEQTIIKCKNVCSHTHTHTHTHKHTHTMKICPHCLFPFVKICSQWSHRLEKRQFPLSNPGLSCEAADKPCTAPLTVSHHLKSNGSGIRVLQKACKFTIHSETHKWLSNMK